MKISGWRARALGCGSALLLAICHPALAGDLALLPRNTASIGAGFCNDGEPVQPLGLPIAVAQTLNLQPQLLIAEADELASRSDVTAARGGFLPQIELSAVDERYVPSNGAAPIVVVDNTVLGGAQTKSAYASFSLQWNLWRDGRDIAGYRGARAGVRAAAQGVDRQLDDTLIGVLKAYSDLYSAEVTARSDARAAAALEAIRVRAQKRYSRGYGTEVAVGQARIEALNAAQTLNGACRDLEDKSAALTEAVGLQMGVLRQLRVAVIPAPPSNRPMGRTMGDWVSSSPAVVEAQENVVSASMKLRQARGEFGPQISISVQRDYLGQDTDSFGLANRRLAPADYRIGLEFQQPLFPLSSEVSDVERARAKLRKAEASYRQAILDVQTNLAQALSARREAERSYGAGQSSLTDAEQVLALTEAQYRAGRKDLDDVEHARMDRDAAEADLEKLGAQRALAEWTADRALYPREFPALLLRRLHLKLRVPGSDENR